MPLLCLTALVFAIFAHAAPLNVADPDTHPYADPAGGRASYALAGETENEARLYDFYQRQADFYMAWPETPSIVPAFPGLDAGKHGHWGKHNQNGHKEPRVSKQTFGSLYFQMLDDKRLKSVGHGAFLQLGDSGQLNACFSPKHQDYAAVWSGDFVTVDPFRWGTSRGAAPAGDMLWLHDKPGWQTTGEFSGLYRHERRIIFDYTLGATRVLDSAWALGKTTVFTRSLRFSGDSQELSLPTIKLPKNATLSTLDLRTPHVLATAGKQQWLIAVRATGATASFSATDLKLKVTDGALVNLYIYRGADIAGAANAIAAAPSDDPATLIHGSPSTWNKQAITVSATLEESKGPIAVDTIPVPFNNPEKSLMMLSGIDFLANGDAIVCCLNGDLWRVSGLDSSLKSVTWRRVARGLNQPFGLRIVDGTLYVMARTQVLALHDNSGDGEYDHFEVVATDFNARSRGIAMHFGLDSDPDGNLIFVNESNVSRWSQKTQKSTPIAKGFRNGMGLATLPDGQILVAPQEGDWTPGSFIAKIREGEDYGFPGFGGKRDAKTPPMDVPFCYVPRGIDCSVGGIVPVTSDAWGPLSGKVIGLSYGYGSQYLLLTGDSGNQGAIVPLEGEFRSGVVRGRMRSQDQNIYIVGCEGWGNYALDDGCLHRLRYTGQPMRRPIGFGVSAKGIRIDFEEKLAPDTQTVFVQSWNVEYASRYGSPEFSVRQPESLGHDVLNVRSSQLLNDGTSIFLEIPDLRPACQVHIRMHLQTADGIAFKTDLFPTIRRFGDTNLKPVIRMAAAPSKRKKKGPKPDRSITLRAIPGLQYNRTELTAAPGERLEIRLQNIDPAMPHNWVLIKPGATKAVGEASFKMLSDPAAAEKSYVPDLRDVLAFVPIVPPNGKDSVVFRVPKTAGEYPFICTFPGHWQAMKGVLIVAEP